MIGAVVSTAVSVMLFQGSKEGKSIYFVPWLSEQIIALCVGVIQGLIMAMSGLFVQISPLHGFIAALVLTINCFMIYCVLSHFFLLRKMKQHSKNIINSVMNGMLSRFWPLCCCSCFCWRGIKFKIEQKRTEKENSII